MSRILAHLLVSTAFAAAAHAAPITTLGAGNTLVSVDSAAPAAVLSTRAITGIGAGQTLLGIDARPVNPRVLYSLSNTGQLYAINAVTAAATAVGAPSPVPNGAVALDFNPAVDRIRVFTTGGQNYRLNPETGAVAGIDTPAAFVPGDINTGAPALTGAAYTNNVAAAPSTTLYGIDTTGRLVRIGSLAGTTPLVSPNSGQTTTVGNLGLSGAFNTNTGFDISSSGEVLAAITSTATGTTSLYRVDLTTGVATIVGQLGATGGNFNGLAFTSASLAGFGATPNQVAIGTAFDNFVGVPSAALTGVFASLDTLAPADRAAALAQFTPASLALLPDLTLRTAEFQEQSLRRYLRDYRAGGTGVAGEAGVAAPGDRKFGSFVIGTASEGRYDATDDRLRTRFGTTGVIAGLDLRLGEKSLIGVTGGYHNLDVNLDGSSPRSNIDSYFGGGYATLGVGPFYVDLFGTYGEANYDLRRAVRFGSAQGGTAFATDLSFQSQFDSRTYLAGGTVGLSFNFAGFEFEPFAGVRYANLRIDGFSEGTGVGAISLGRNKYESVLSNAGLRIGGAFDIGNATFRPEIRGAYRHEFQKDGERGFTFGFGGPGTGPLTLAQTPLGRDYATAGAGFTVSGPNSPLSFVVDYNGEFDDDRRIHSVTGGLRLTF